MECERRVTENMERLIAKEEIARRVKEIARQISADYEGKSLVLVGILRGCVMFLADVMRELDPKLDVEVDFITASSYGNGMKSTGEVTIFKDTISDLSGKHVLLVDDIIDTGATLAKLRVIFAQRAETVKTAVILSKPARRVEELEADYIGFEIPDRFVVGYGLDYAQKYRNLAEIFAYI